jgi:two-component system, chemotaxis family, protein-glutamate methylesterase/glutaminase
VQVYGDDGLRGVVAIGASAGGVEALSRLITGLSPDLPYVYLVTLHVAPGAPSILARILDRCGQLPVVTAEDGQPLRPAHIYVARPDHHLLVADNRIVVSRGPKENGHRPAINALFRSVALEFGPHAIGGLLSGVLDDGVLGLAAIRARGGVTIAQAPDDALFPALPANACAAGVVDHQAAAADIGGVLKKLSQREIRDSAVESDRGMAAENDIATRSRFAIDFDTRELGTPPGHTCPDCGGSPAVVGDNSFRCRTGHTLTNDALHAGCDGEIEGALSANGARRGDGGG